MCILTAAGSISILGSLLGASAGCASVLGADFDRAAADAAGETSGMNDVDGASSTSPTTTVGRDGGGSSVGDMEGGLVMVDPVDAGDDDDQSDATSTVDSGGAVDDASTGCPAVPTAGSLEISEMMLTTSEASAGGDRGEWLEITNVTACPLLLDGLVISSPNQDHGGTSTVTIEDGYTVPPHGTFIVADSLVASDNHGLPGHLYAWNDEDTLDDDDDTVTVTLAGVTITNWEFSFDDCAFRSTSNCYATSHSMEQPIGCPPREASKWKPATMTPWVRGSSFYGTPNAPNDITGCP